MVQKLTLAVAVVAMVTVVYISGCSQSETPQQASPSSAAKNPAMATNAPDSAASAEGGEHGHKPGEHGGIIVSLGRDSYHAEAVFEQGGMLRLYMLGQDETRVQEVESQELVAYVKPDGGSESISVPVQPQPQPGDTEGKTSQFVAQLPSEVQGVSVAVTIPSVRIGGERFRLGFTSASDAHGEEAMPDKVSDAAEVQLYLTAGGLYTKADIQANGNMTASQKFKGFRADHDLKPKPGDKICPVTLTKANPKVSWIIGGKTYEFCCPPCVDEFVTLAKESPEEIQDPAAYVQQ